MNGRLSNTRFGVLDMHFLILLTLFGGVLRHISKESVCFCEESFTIALVPDITYLSHFALEIVDLALVTLRTH